MTEGHKPKHPRKGERYRTVNGRRVVLGITHNRTGYTNYKCRCGKCTRAQADYMAKLRAEKALQEV
jgi:hypothetical protein